MKYFDWDIEKNNQLKKQKEISFEEVILSIQKGKLLDVQKHHNPKKYPNQKIFIIEINNYVYLVPFVEDENKYFLKTIIPSRKATKKYLQTKMNYIKLDKKEKKILADYEYGKYKSIPNLEREKKQYQKAARFALNRTKNINIRIAERDLLKIKARAFERGIPYQTLVSSLLHQFSNDQIKELSR